MVTWEVICANILAIITNGGTAGMFWGFLIVVVGYLLVYASLAEMSSMVRANRVTIASPSLTDNAGRDSRWTVSQLNQQTASWRICKASKHFRSWKSRHDFAPGQARHTADKLSLRYHWVSEFAPPSSQKYLSYMTGWLTMIGWQSAITGIGMLVATIIQGVAVLNNPDYSPTRWQATLITIAVVAFCVVFNTFLARKLPLVEGCLAVLHFGGLFVIIIIL